MRVRRSGGYVGSRYCQSICLKEKMSIFSALPKPFSSPSLGEIHYTDTLFSTCAITGIAIIYPLTHLTGQ